MVSGVALNTSMAAMPNYNAGLSNNNNSNALLNFGNNGLMTGYEDDIMMSNMDFAQIAANPQAALMQTPTVGTTPSMTGGQTQQTGQPDEGELAGYLQQRDRNTAVTESGNRYVKTNAGKTFGAVLGFLSPVVGKVVSLIKGAKFKDLFKFKQLAIACPALAVAGLGLGALIDGFCNSKKAQKADELAAQTQTQAQTVQQQMNTLT